jgi:hypothetical protein
MPEPIAMFARPNAHHHQVAYVTNDLDRAVALFEREYAAPGFFVFDNVSTGAATPGGPRLRIALSNVGGVEIELIEPIGDTAPLYQEVLSPGPELQIRFHHVATRIDRPIENWEAHAASIDTVAHPIAIQGQMGDDLRFLYTDERSRIGHYVEHVRMSPAILEQLGAAVPHFPPKG